MNLLAERLREAATAVAHARYALPGRDGWQQWHEYLYDAEITLLEAAEQVHIAELEHQASIERREFWTSVIQAVRR